MIDFERRLVLVGAAMLAVLLMALTVLLAVSVIAATVALDASEARRVAMARALCSVPVVVRDAAQTHDAGAE